MSIWDDNELRDGGEFFKFENAGDTISGTVTGTRIHRWDDGSASPQILLTTDDGEDKTVTAGQVQLKRRLAAERPEAGDRIKITLTGVEKRAGGKTLKLFDVQVTRGAQTPATSGGNTAAPTAAPPF